MTVKPPSTLLQGEPGYELIKEVRIDQLLKGGKIRNPNGRIRKHLVPVNDQGCAVWPKTYKGDGGYGRLQHDGELVRVHRLSYEQHIGPIPFGMQVLHECDNPSCVNPAHLWLGDHKDNAEDASLKGRLPGRPEKLTEDDVRAIRAARYASSGFLAQRYGVSIRHVQMIRTGQKWSNVR